MKEEQSFNYEKFAEVCKKAYGPNPIWQLHNESGVSASTLYNWNGKLKRFPSTSKLNPVLAALKKRGYDLSIGDLYIRPVEPYKDVACEKENSVVCEPEKPYLHITEESISSLLQIVMSKVKTLEDTLILRDEKITTLENECIVLKKEKEKLLKCKLKGKTNK